MHGGCGHYKAARKCMFSLQHVLYIHVHVHVHVTAACMHCAFSVVVARTALEKVILCAASCGCLKSVYFLSNKYVLHNGFTCIVHMSRLQ